MREHLHLHLDRIQRLTGINVRNTAWKVKQSTVIYSVTLFVSFKSNVNSETITNMNLPIVPAVRSTQPSSSCFIDFASITRSNVAGDAPGATLIGSPDIFGDLQKQWKFSKSFLKAN